MNTRAPRRRQDDGRVLLLVIGSVVVLAMAVAVVVDTGRLYLARRALDSATDAAALSGSQAADLDAVYAGRTGSDVPLDPGRARRAVRDYLDDAGIDRDLDGFALTDVEVDGTAITVTTRATVRLPFVGPITRGRATVVVRSSATARNRVAGP